MSQINTPRVLIGGVLAGIVVNIGEFLLNGVILADYYAEMGGRLGLPAMTTKVFVVFILLSLLLGIAAVWLYAAARPRLGPGVLSAAKIALAVWFFGYVNSAAGLWGIGLMDTNTALLALTWGFVEIQLAVIMGAWLYREP